ncbi:hypothetical protein C8J56DRAFT_788702 [Mycena floridula]|nr:hypothetical protein C8J56DRAFT_788702 [Mycena floridula]
MGWAHVHFSSVEQAQTFIDSVSNHDISFGDRFQRAEFARHKTPLRGAERTRNPPSDTLFVGNLPYAADEVDVREALEPYGALKRVSVAYDFNKVSRGFAHVSFVNAADATAAMENEDLVIMGRRPRIDYAPVKPVINHPPSHKCFFSNFIGEESELHRALGEELAQKVVSIYFLKDKYTNQPTGSGFVDFKSVDDATTALEHTNGTLNLRYATPLRKNNPNASPKSSYGSDWGR